jgi:ParB family chromosome partitioning protein
MAKLDELRSGMGQNALSSLGAGRTPPRLSGSIAPARAASAPAARQQGMKRSQDTAEIDLDRIDRDPDQPREEFDEEGLRRLAGSLKARGQLQPIRVRWDEGRGLYVIVCGERRWRAARMAGLPSLTCVIHEGPLADGEKLALQLVENAVREDLKPVEQARAYRALMENNGWDGKTLAAELAIDPATVTRALALLDLPAPVQEKVEQGALPASTAYEISRLPDPVAQAEMADVAVAEGLTKTDVREAVRNVKARKAAATPAAKPEPFVDDQGDCTVTVRWKRVGGPDAATALERALERARQAEDNAA